MAQPVIANPYIVAKQPDLCTVAISDARHDFPTNFNNINFNKTIQQLQNTLAGEQVHTDTCPILYEDDLIKSVIGLQRNNGVFVKPQNISSFRLGEYASAPTNYIKNYAKIYIPPENSSRNLDILLKFGNSYGSAQSNDELGVRDQAIYFIVDTKNSAFGEFLRTTETKLSTNKAKYIYVQNRHTLYDPLDKVNLSTPSGKEIFYKIIQERRQTTEKINPSVQFAWEDTSPGMTQYVTYPNWASGQQTLYRNFYSRHMLFQTLKGKPDEYKKHDTKVFMRLMSPTGTPTNNLVVFNKEIAQKSGGVMAALFSFGNDDIQNVRQIIGSSDGNIIKIQNEHHYIAKRLGDQGQALSACESTLRLLLKSDIQTIEQHQSNGKHCFVTFDRPALAFALMVGVPMVLFCYTNGAFDLYVHQKINSQGNMLLNNKDRYNRLLTSLTVENNQLVNILNNFINYRDRFIYNYNNKLIYTIDLIIQWLNDKTDYQTYIRRFLLISRYIHVLNSVDINTINSLYNNLGEFNEIHKDITNIHEQLISVGQFTTTRGMQLNMTKLNIMYSEQINTLEQYKSLIELGYNVLNDIYAPSLPYKPNDNMVDLSVVYDNRANTMINMTLVENINIQENLRHRTFLSKIDVLTGSVFVKTILEALYTLKSLYTVTLEQEIQRLQKPFTEQNSIDTLNTFFNNLARIVQTTPNISEDHQRVILEKLQSIQQSVYQSSNIPDLPLNSVYTIGPARSNELAEYQLQQNNIYEYNMIGGLRKNTIVTPTLADYYKYDAYLRSWCIIMACIHDLDVKVLQDTKNNSYTKLKYLLANDVMDFLFYDTDKKNNVPKNNKGPHFMQKYENQPIYYYDYFWDQVHDFPDLQKLYYDINRPYMEGEIPYVTITSQMYENVVYALTQSYIYEQQKQQHTLIRKAPIQYSNKLPAYNNMLINNNMSMYTNQMPRQIMAYGGKRRTRKHKKTKTKTRKHTRYNRKQRK